MAGKQTPLLRSSRPARIARHAQRHHPILLHMYTDCDDADDIRRSGRSTKGQHTKNKDELDEAVAAAAKPKPKVVKNEKKPQPEKDVPRSQSAQSAEQPEAEGEDDAYYRCVCGDQREIRGREMICCDKCEAWQHNKCLNLPSSEYWEDKLYYCEQCRPDDHRELLEAMARGEKPWNRKKGSKGAKPKFRPSDVGSEATATPEKKDAPSPHPAPAPTPTPAPAAPEAPAPSNGQSEAKVHPQADCYPFQTDLIQPPKKPTLKSQPQSPLGEKRSHDAVADKDTSAAKRRKSSAQHNLKTGANAPVSGSSSLPEKRKKPVDMLIAVLADIIKNVKDYRIPDGATPTSIATRFTLQIDLAAVAHFGEPTENMHPYIHQFRALMVNTKKNRILVERLLSGTLTPEELATMPAEEMASEDKQRKIAAMREAVEKQSILQDETGPRIRKTHKGEEIVGQDNMDVEFRPPERRDTMDDAKPVIPPSPQDEHHRVVELPEDVANRSAMSIDTSAPQLDSTRRPSTNFSIDQIFQKVQSPSQTQGAFLHRRQSSIRPQQHTPQEDNVVDADVDRLLKDEDNDVEMTGYPADPTIIWRGSIEMQAVGTFDAAARFVAGGDFGQILPWDQLMIPNLPIQGRVEDVKGDDYIRGLPQSGQDVAVLSISPITDEGKVLFDNLYNYFQPRRRWGVVPPDALKHPLVKDLYIIPIEPGGSELPGFLNMLEHCTIETPRTNPMLLLALVAKLPEMMPGAQLPPQNLAEETPSRHGAQPVQPAVPIVNGSMSTNGPSPSPVNPHGPQYSPVQAGFPQDGLGRATASNYPPPNGPHGQGPFPIHQNGHPVPPPHQGPTPPQSQSQPPSQHQLPPNPFAQPQQQPPFGQSQAPPQITPPLPQAPQHPPPPHHLKPHALAVFGPFIDSPVVVQLLTGTTTEWTSDQMTNLRHIMEKVPAARGDMQVLMRELQSQQPARTPGV